MTIKSLLILLIALVTPDWVGKTFTRSIAYLQLKNDGYYTAEDFKSVKKFDTHVHVNTDEITFVKLAQDDNFEFLDIVDDRPFGLPWTEQQKIALGQNFPRQMEFATTFSVKGFNDEGWAENTIKELKLSLSKGAKAFKIWKNIGMDLRDDQGKFVNDR